MGAFEEFLTKAKDGFDIAAKKTGEVITVQKLKLSIASINSDIDKKYESIGKLYADTVKNNTDNAFEINSLIAEIDEKNEEIEKIEKEISEATNKKTCAVCGAKNSTDAAFCSRCGAELN